MKQKHIFSLLDQTFTTVQVKFDSSYDLDEIHEDAGPFNYREKKAAHPKAPCAPSLGYTYKVPKDWNVKEGDYLAVLTERRGLAVVTVVNVDEGPQIDVDADFTYRWVVQRIDMREFQELTLKEQKFGEAMLEVERVKQRESLMDSFRNSLPEGSAARALFEQTTASLASPSVPPAPPSGEGNHGDAGDHK